MANWQDPQTTGVTAATVGVPRAARDVGLRSYMLSVYNYMASGVLLTGIVAMLFANSSLINLIATVDGAGQVHATPLSAPDLVDADALAELVRREYAAPGISPQSIETGAVIITGETARTKNAEAILQALSAGAGDFVVTIAGPNAEAQIAGRGSGAARWSTATGMRSRSTSRWG